MYQKKGRLSFYLKKNLFWLRIRLGETMKKLNVRKLKKLTSSLIWKDKKHYLGLSLSFDMNLVKSEEDLEEVLLDAVKTLKFVARKELRIFREKP